MAQMYAKSINLEGGSVTWLIFDDGSVILRIGNNTESKHQIPITLEDLDYLRRAISETLELDLDEDFEREHGVVCLR